MSGSLAWAVGSWGEFDWVAIYAPTEEDAKDLWKMENDHRDCGEPDVQRRPEWDEKNVITGDKTWFESGLGVHCEECGYETWRDNGGAVVKGQILCEDCQPQQDETESEGAV